jgi:uncharacterized protein
MTGREGRDDSGLRGRIAAFLAAHNTMSLATADADGMPSVAAVFYAADAHLNLYLLSEERTEHGRNLLERGWAAGAIQDDGQDWRAICGLQLRGRVEMVPLGLPWVHAAAVYGKRFAFIDALLAGTGGPALLAGPLAKARFWVLRPIWLRLIDNTVQFGHKEELVLPEGEGDVA